MTSPRPAPKGHSPLPWSVRIKEGELIQAILDANGVCFIDNTMGPNQTRMANAELIVKAVNLYPRLRDALEAVDKWFEFIEKDQHEKLVLGQTLESASENWEKLEVPTLDMKPIKALLRECKGEK